MNKKTITLFFILGTAFLTALLLTAISYLSDVLFIEKAKQREMHLVSVMILDELRDQAETAEARVSLITNLPVIQDAFRAKNRQIMVDRLLPAFLIQRQKFDVNSASFYTPPAVSFLRLFDLESQGEDVSAFREIILKANQQKKSQKGIEIGREGPTISAVNLIKDGQDIIGSFEIGLNFKRILNDIKESTGFDVGIFIDKRLMNAIATDVPKPSQDHIIGNFQIFDTTDWGKIHSVVSPILLNAENDITYKIVKINGLNYGIVVIPLLDFKGLQIGSIVAVNDFENYSTDLKANLSYTLAVVLLQSLILAGVILIAFNKLLPLAGVESPNIAKKND